MNSFRFRGAPNNTYSIAVPIRADRSGYLGRECPNPKCLKYFKVTPGTGVKGSAPCHCPYCGHTGDSNTFGTRQQIEYGASIAKQQFIQQVHQNIRNTFGRNRNVTYTPGPPIPIRHYRELDLESEIVCDECGLRYAIYGEFAWCPDCGVHNSLQILNKNLELAKRRLEFAASADKDLAHTFVADALSGIVASFDGFGREVCKNNAKVSFQNLECGRKAVIREYGFDVAEVVSDDEWTFCSRSFQKRHLLMHRMGVVDEDYKKHTTDTSAIVGRKIALPSSEVATLIELIERIGKRLYEGVMQKKA